MIRHYLTAGVPKAEPVQTETVGSRAGYAMDKLVADDKIDFRTPEGRKLLYNLYRRDTMNWRIVKSLSSLTVARGFKIIPPNDKAAAVIKDFLYRIHKTDPVNAMMVWVRNLTEDTTWSGNGPRPGDGVDPGLGGGAYGVFHPYCGTGSGNGGEDGG